MRNLLLTAGLVTALAVPALAQAQTRCEQSRSTNRAVGTVVGAGIGALLGSAIAGNSSNTAGVIVGGVAGGVAGNQIAKNSGAPCPTGYYEVPGPTVAPTPTAFWSGSAAGIRERTAYLEQRIRDAEVNGTITRRDARQAYTDLASVRRSEVSLRNRDGGRLTIADRDYLQARLDTVGQRVNWAQRTTAYNNTYYPSPNVEASTSVGGYYDSNGVWRPYAESARGYYDAQGYWHAN